MATLAEAVAAIAARTGTPLGRVQHIARKLQAADMIPLAVGTAVPAIHVEHVTSLLIAFLSDAQLDRVAGAVSNYGSLVEDGIDPDAIGMPASVRRPLVTVRDYLEQIIAIMASGTAEERAGVARFHVEAVSNWPEVRIFDPREPGASIRFISPGAPAGHWQQSVRRSVTLDGHALARIMSGLRLTR